jgi:5'-nucleotidase
MQEYLIINPENLEKFKKALAEQGFQSMHVVSDFDRTLTKAFVNGKKIPSLISVIRDGNYLSSDYAEKAHALFNKYHPTETDTKIPLTKKKKAMHQWWSEHFKLLIQCGLTKKDIERAVNDGNVQLREGAGEFLDFLAEKEIPLLILSSCGLGTEAISLFLKKEGKMRGNIHIISNTYIWNADGKAIGIKEPIIHSLNKEEASIKSYPDFKAVQNKKNVLLLGDSLSDTDMIEGFEYKNLLKIGFLNFDVERDLGAYKKAYDFLVLNDSSMNEINKFLGEIK